MLPASDWHHRPWGAGGTRTDQRRPGPHQDEQSSAVVDAAAVAVVAGAGGAGASAGPNPEERTRPRRDHQRRIGHFLGSRHRHEVRIPEVEAGRYMTRRTSAQHKRSALLGSDNREQCMQK